MSNNREWMYQRLDEFGYISDEFLAQLETFISFALSHPNFMDRHNLRCPCKKCDNRKFHPPDVVRVHLASRGFIPNYFNWHCQGEPYIFPTDNRGASSSSSFDPQPLNSFREMVVDAIGTEFHAEPIEEDPNPKAQQFFDMLNSADTELFLGCRKHSQLSATVEKIDCCRLGCMLYWGVDADLNACKFCDNPRYKHQRGSSSHNSNIPFKQMYYFPLTPRLQRLYASKATSSHMRWHSEHEQKEGVMSHPSDSLAWKHFDVTNPFFAAESRNVRLGLCTDGFQPFGQSGQQYSSWPVIVTPYNLPPWMCMSEPYMFLSVIVRQQRLEQQEDNTQVLDENQIFIEAATGKRRDRVYGIGSVASLVGNNSASTAAPSSSIAYTMAQQ